MAVVERKSLEDLAHSLVDGRLAAQLGELAAVGRAAVVVEERYSKLFTLPFVRPGWVADLLAQAQVRWTTVPVFFAETRPLAAEWTYRFLAAAAAEGVADGLSAQRLAALVSPRPLAAAPATVGEMRSWAVERGLTVSDRGQLRASVVAAYRAAHR